MNDIGASWDRRGEFLVNYDPNTKDLNIPCEITIEASPKNRARSMNSAEIEKIADLFNSARGSPAKKADIIKAQESVKMGVGATFTYNGVNYKITPLQKDNKEQVAKLKQIADMRKEKIHLVTVNPDTASSKRINDAATLSRSAAPSPTAQSPNPNAKPILPPTGWIRLERYLGFRTEKKIGSKFFEVKENNNTITNPKEMEAIEAAINKPNMKAKSDTMLSGKDVEITIKDKTYQLVLVDHSTTPEKQTEYLFDLVKTREKYFLEKTTVRTLLAEDMLKAANDIRKAMADANQTKSSTALCTSPPSLPPLPPIPLRQSITKDTSLGKTVSSVSNQIISPTGTVARRPAPIPPATIGKTSSKVLPPLPTPPASRRNSLTSSAANSPKAASPTAAPRLDLWTDKKTTALLDKFILLDVSMKRPIMDKDVATQILKNHYDKLSRDDRAQFDVSLQGDNETIKFGQYSLIRKNKNNI